MPHIHSITELKNNFNQLADICSNGNEPVFLTSKGHGEFVLLSHAGYEMMQAKLDLYQKLDEAELESRNSSVRFTHDEVMQQLRSRLA